MTNNEVVRNFCNHKVGKSLNMKSTGDKLFSYKTCVAEWRGETLYVNTTKYSQTTSKQTCELRAFASDYKRIYGKVEYVDCGEFSIASVYGAWLGLVQPKSASMMFWAADLLLGGMMYFRRHASRSSALGSFPPITTSWRKLSSSSMVPAK